VTRLGRSLAAWRDAPETREFSLWVLGPRRASFEAARPLIEAVGRAQERVRIILTGPDEDLAWLKAQFPGYAVHLSPPPFGVAVRRFLHRANLRGVLALDDVAPSSGVLPGLAEAGLPLVHLMTGAGGGGTPGTSAAAVDRLGLGDLDESVRRLGEALARDHKLLRKSAKRRTTPSALLVAATRRPAARRLVARRFRRFEDAEALAEAIGRPRTIMALGNGPSSEDPALAGMAHDALFRVNRSWAGRTHLTRPDVVFTSGRTTMRAIEGAVFGLRSEASEVRLAGARAFDPRRGPTRYFRADEIAPALGAFDWGAFRPTNGATMLASAVALGPDRLIVAGIDMFRHPDGAYPGDAATPNAFAPAHDPEAELAFLLGLLASYAGELVIVGDVLRSAWEARAPAGLPSARPKE
jgi:hypothetical protein